MPNEDFEKFRISQKDHDSLVDKMSDTFAALATAIDDIEDPALTAQMDAFFRSMIKHTVIMEQDLNWAQMILSSALEQSDLHPAVKTQAEGFINAYEKKYVPLEIRDAA